VDKEQEFKGFREKHKKEMKKKQEELHEKN